MIQTIRLIDSLSAAFGKAFAWLIIMMTLGTSYEVLVRYVFNNPTPWAYDVSFIMYGTMFMMAGAYTLSRGQHVRGDFLYRSWQPRTQGKVDLVLYLTFFYPGVLALVFTGWKYSSRSWGYGEVSVNSPAGVPIYQFKSVLVAAGLLLAIQGVAEIMRCIIAIRQNRWMTPEDDVVETEDLLIRQATQAEAGSGQSGGHP